MPEDLLTLLKKVLLVAAIGSAAMAFTRPGHTITPTRAQKGATASPHQQGETVHLCQEEVGQTAQRLVSDLLASSAFVNRSFIDRS